MEERSRAWSAVFRALPLGWTVGDATYSSVTGVWTVTASDGRSFITAASRRQPITASGGSEVEAARRLAELLEAETAEASAAGQRGDDPDVAAERGRSAGAHTHPRPPPGVFGHRGSRPPRVRCFPPEDVRFASRVERLIAAVGEAHGHVDARSLAKDLEQYLPHLRRDYPAARLVVQAPLAMIDGSPVVYAYRDGHMLPTGRLGPGAMRRPGGLEAILLEAVESRLRAEAAMTEASELMRRAVVACDRAAAARQAREESERPGAWNSLAG